MDSNNVVDVILELININRDGKKGYQDAAEHAKAADLKSSFRQQAGERARFAKQLETEPAQLVSKRPRKGPDMSRLPCTGVGLR